MMKRTTAALALPLLLLISGCGEGSDTPYTEVDQETVQLSGNGTSAEAAGSMAATFALQPVGAGSVSGEATLSESAGRTDVMVRLTGSVPDATHQGHIHQGTCDNIGPVVAPLEPVQTDAQGTGTSTASVDLALQDAMNGQHLVSYHEANGNPGAPVTCGEIPAFGS